MTSIIAETKDTSLALGEYHVHPSMCATLMPYHPDAVMKLLSVLNLTDNDRTVLATTLLSDIPGEFPQKRFPSEDRQLISICRTLWRR